MGISTNTYFRIGRSFKIYKINKSGKKEEINEPIIIEYVTRDGFIEVEIEDRVVQKIVTTQSKEIMKKELYNSDEYKMAKKDQC